uniref:T9SS type B sorting domain-containing protein n=2 Tax=Roseivirga sp. TaxID=1964215 RepID=UPI0040486A96
MVEKYRFLLLLLGITFAFGANAQNFTRHNWYFSNNNQALVFGKARGSDAFLADGKLPQTNLGEKITATDPTTGDLLFYSDGTNIYDATNTIMPNGNGLTTANEVQAMAISPVPGSNSLYYLFHRNNAGVVLFTVVDMSQQGNRTNGPPSGVVTAQKNIPTLITSRGGGMLSIASGNLSQFWLVTQNSTNGNFEIHRIPALSGTFDPQGAPTALAVNIQAAHLSINPTGTQIAVLPANNVNIQILDFNRDAPELMFNRAIANSFVPNQTLTGSIGWSLDGSKLFFSRNSAANGNVYRIDLNDSLASVEPIFSSPLGESQSLLLAPDSSIYHIYRETLAGPRRLGRITQADSAITNLAYETALFGEADPASNYFQQFMPASAIGPIVTIAENGDYCMNNPVQFYVNIDPPTAIPISYNWDIQPFGLSSNAVAPIFTFEEAGFYSATLTVEFEGLGGPVLSNTIMGEILENDIQVSLNDTTICAGETLNLDAEPQSGGQGQSGGATGGPFTYRWSTGATASAIDVTEAGNYWVVITPTTGCPIYETVEVTVYGDENPTANIWYFGNGAGIDFNEVDGLDPPPRSITVAHAMDAPEGTSTISDANGDVLFYTDGSSVWNAINTLMPNGTDIGGDINATQSVLIVPFSDDETLFYLFTTEEIYGSNTYMLKYSVVDMKEDNGLGDVIVKNNVLFTKSTEKLAALEGGNGYWLLSHEYGTNTFRSYPISNEGIGAPILSSVGSIHSLNDALSGQAGMKFSGDGSRVAVALIEGNDDYIELFQFDQNSGELTEFEYQIDLSIGGPAANDQLYDVHFSPGGGKIFATLNNRNGGTPGGRILEYRIDTASTEDSRNASKANIAASATAAVNYGAIQTGPDGQLYVAMEVTGNPGATNFVGAINPNEDTASVSSFNQMQIMLTTGNSRLGLPNFVQNNANPPMEPAISAPDTTCVEERIALSGIGTSDIDEFLWTIIDEASNTVFSAAGQDTAYVFPQGQAGRFNISLNISNRCGFDTTFVQQIDVFDIPPRPAIPTAVVICEGASFPLDALGGAPDDPSLSFRWTNSQGAVVSTSRFYTVDQEEIYTATITSIGGGGCVSSASVFAAPPFEIELPPTATICQDEALTLDPRVNANNYQWSRINPDNSTSTLATTRTIAVDSSVPGIYTYIISIEDPASIGCFVNDSTVVTINGSPNLSQGAITDPTCGNSDGAFSFNIGGTGNYSYTVTDAGGAVVSQNNATDGPASIPVSGLDGGTYSVSITDNSTNCTDNLTGIALQNNNFTVAAVAANANCNTNDGSITVTLNDATNFPVTYILTRAEAGFAPLTGNAAANGFSIPNLGGGTYSIEVTSTASGCVASATNILLSQPTDVQNLQIVPDNSNACAVTNPSVQLTASSTNGTIYNWISPSGASLSGASITATESGTYTVTASAPTACPVSTSTIVTLTIQPDIDIVVNGDVCNGSVELEARILNENPSTVYDFLWSTGENGRRITVSASGTYEVTVREAGDLTCSATASEPITIPEALDATLTSGPACDDGQPITLTVTPLSGNATSFTWTRDGQSAGTGNPFVTSEEGSYTVTISDGTCSIERSILIRRSGIPEGLLADEDFYCPTSTNSLVVLAGIGFSTYEWTLDGQPIANSTGSLTVASGGLYEVTMTTAAGCVRVDQINIIESCDPVVHVPNVLLPEGTAPNNVFKAFPNGFVSDFQVFIYNRWGELIYQNSSPEFEWDGTFNGQIVPIGTYPYVIKFKSRFEPERGEFEQRGAVTVIR